MIAGRSGAPEVREFADVLRQFRQRDGRDPEVRMVICGIGWEHYLALDHSLGDDRPGRASTIWKESWRSSPLPMNLPIASDNC